MKIKRAPIVFHNVISTKSRCKTDEWFHIARDFRNAIIKNDLYNTGPLIYKVSNFDKSVHEADYTFYVPVNMTLELDTNDKYQFYKEWKFDDGLTLRHADLDDDIEESYELIRASAKAYNLELEEPFYNIFLDVYGEGIIDIYSPIMKEG
ncbi:DUF5085 family protein [Cytobacillus purgationiresistens]|uniref:DUF5085 family protein n=1 Tax=Cytobacillus purgationiresistens TaxID=863449 RepID=A0ABU0ANA1_9BACI|nr:DUF5085 family protein [Cytobacillus purgationiresistens]MDQ0272732.1 hypothetical protein [Cytobacillus purgationiresistens]